VTENISGKNMNFINHVMNAHISLV
jgi:hypothetical protein